MNVISFSLADRLFQTHTQTIRAWLRAWWRTCTYMTSIRAWTCGLLAPQRIIIYSVLTELTTKGKKPHTVSQSNASLVLSQNYFVANRLGSKQNETPTGWMNNEGLWFPLPETYFNFLGIQRNINLVSLLSSTCSVHTEKWGHCLGCISLS